MEMHLESLASDRPQDSGTAIRILGLNKVYKLYDSPRDRLWESVHPFRRKIHRKFYALRDVSFEVRAGETIGIVGRNGSGKSTLLKIISGVLTPTDGQVEVKGKVSAILELGAGFNPEISGLENVYFSGSLMGFSRQVMDARIDDILNFADIGDYVYQPVKTYSSGMMVRLAFSVQTMVDANILIVDEALAVGDEAFQRKCFSRLEALRRQGATLLYVSHHASSVIALCNHALFMHRGELILEGRPKFVVSCYQRIANAPDCKSDELVQQLKESRLALATQLQADGIFADEDTNSLAPPHPEPLNPTDSESFRERFDPHLKPKSTVHYASNGARIENVRITNEAGETVNILARRQTYQFRYEVVFIDDCEDVAFAMLIKTITGVHLGGARSFPLLRGRIARISAGTRYAVCFAFVCNLNPNVFFFNAGVEGVGPQKQGPYLHRIMDACMFRVLDEANLLATGQVDFHVEPTVTVQSESVFPPQSP